MNILVSSGNVKLESVVKNLKNHSVEIVNDVTKKNMIGSDCLIILSSIEPCNKPEEFNLKIQKIYNTLSTAVEEGIKKVIMISSLDVFNYEENYTVTENWKTTPRNDFNNLSINLSEIVFREFGRTFPFQKILLRVGFPISNELKNGGAFSCFTSEQDLLKTISKLIEINFKNNYEIFHLQTEVDNQKYLTKKLNDMENLSTKVEDHFYHPRNKKL